MKKLISVIGSDDSDENLSKYALEIAEEIGRQIAQKDGILICGGRGGIMKAACKGAKEKNGITVGILPKTKKEANNYVDIPIISGLGNRRNSIIAFTSDAVIAIAGRWGTLNEISYSMIFNKTLILLKGTGGIVDEICLKNLYNLNDKENIFITSNVNEAIEIAFGK